MADNKTPSSDARVRQSMPSPASRETRAVADRSRTDLDGTALSRTERTRRLRSEFQQEALPNAPEVEGFHTCWLVTNSSYDPVHKRMRMGYVPVRPDEVPGMETFRMKSGDMGDMVVCNEMALFKIPNEQYLEIMRAFHHDLPLDAEESIVRNLKQGHKDSNGRPLEEVEGFEDMAINTEPQFAL